MESSLKLHLRRDADVASSKVVTVQQGCGIDYLLGSYALENIKDAERKQAKVLSLGVYIDNRFARSSCLCLHQ